MTALTFVMPSTTPHPRPNTPSSLATLAHLCVMTFAVAMITVTALEPASLSPVVTSAPATVGAWVLLVMTGLGVIKTDYAWTIAGLAYTAILIGVMMIGQAGWDNGVMAGTLLHTVSGVIAAVSGLLSLDPQINRRHWRLAGR